MTFYLHLCQYNNSLSKLNKLLIFNFMKQGQLCSYAAQARGRKSHKKSACDVIKMRVMRREVGKKTHKKEMDYPLFL